MNEGYGREAGEGRLMKVEAWMSADTVALARALIGKVLVLKDTAGRTIRRTITETEAYDGPDDKASHASRGKTVRNARMFEAGGIWYVYLCYGVHEMLNLVTGPAGYPAAVLIRGVEGIEGPGRLTNRLGIDRRFNGQPACGPEASLWIEDAGVVVPAKEIRATSRVGVAYAGRVWAAKPWRFVWAKKTPRGKPRRVEGALL